MFENSDTISPSLGSLLSAVNANLNTSRSFEETYGAELALHFDPITEIWGFRENPSSRILAFFLNPGQTHGQGECFLRSFLNLVCPEMASHLKSPHSVQTEFTIPDGRRIDLVVEYRDPSFCIALENKLGAADGPDQVDDYTRYLQSSYPFSEERIGQVFVYLTPNGSKPEEWSMKTGDGSIPRREGEFKCLSWKEDIILLLDEWWRLSRSDHVRWFLKSFGRALRNKLGLMEINQEKRIADQILQTTDGLSAAFAVANSMDVLRSKLCEKLVEDCRGFEDKDRTKWEVKHPESLWPNTNFEIVFSKLRWGGAGIFLGCEDRPSEVYIGVSYPGGVEKSPLPKLFNEEPDLKAKLDRLAPLAGEEESFPQNIWLTGKFFPYPYQNWNQPDVWIDIQKGSGSEFYKILQETLCDYSALLDLAADRLEHLPKS